MISYNILTSLLQYFPLGLVFYKLNKPNNIKLFLIENKNVGEEPIQITTPIVSLNFLNISFDSTFVRLSIIYSSI
jgi:hypothetical protein